MMIYTGSYNNCKGSNTVSISGDRGKLVEYDGEVYSKIAPKLSFWKVWHDNIGKISDQENNIYYIKEYYKEVLSLLDPKQALKDLDNSILLCYEEPQFFCHRHIVAAWLEMELGIIVNEVKIIDDKIIEIKRDYQTDIDYKKYFLNTRK